ncbi:S-adenosylmethionine-dependent methyltransferase-like protein [Achaetomium macrosporum]|uniref:40S ribosomal protein S24 n=1 Tax=Achaetomium macrosporum TaxID=79813 RepID=A0AAN7C2A4_9PEZI|nr:S-adenosylmethionine-dependent methyltransferase-like protein [Achaetomium macrosporum]
MSSVSKTNPQVSRFCWQVLQLEPAPGFPDAELLREESVQDAIYEGLFAFGDDVAPSLPPRYQLRILKQLIAKIESAIQDWDQHGVSDKLMSVLTDLLLQPLPSEETAVLQECHVTYHLSLLQRTPTTQRPHITLLETRSLISGSGTTGLRTWEAALHLGQYLCANPSLVRNKRILELGSGTGYLAVLCAKYLGADHVVASDGSDDVVKQLPRNFDLNGLQGSEKVAATQLRWGTLLADDTGESEWGGGGVDMVVGADITYDSWTSRHCLGPTMRDLATLFPGVPILIAATERNRETFENFLQWCRENRFVIVEVSPTSTAITTAKMADSDSPVTLRTRKFIRNPLLGRKQMVVDILHPNRPNISKDELRDKLAGMYKAQKDQVSVFGLRTQFGGGKTTGFALIYDSPEAMKKFEPHYRLVRVGLATKVEKASRQQRKQRKNRQKTLRGTAKVKGAKSKKEK